MNSSHKGHKGHDELTENQIAKLVLDAAFLVHTKLGSGLLESVYEVVLAHELQKPGSSALRKHFVLTSLSEARSLSS